MARKINISKKITDLMKRFEKEFGSLAPIRFSDPLEALVVPLLAGWGSVERGNDILEDLKGQFCDLNELRVARNSEITPFLSKMLHYERDPSLQLATNLRRMLTSIFQAQGITEVAHLTKAKVSDQKRLVTALEGVDKDMHNGMLLLAFQHNVVPIDSHVLQFLTEAKMVPNSATVFQAGKALESALDREQYLPFYRYSRRMVEGIVGKDGNLNLKRVLAKRLLGKS